jgi:nucleotide-binding universal stress UspA family protein
LSELKEQKISKILVGVDGSEESLHAVDYAIYVARKFNAEVIALNVILSYVTIFGPAVPQYISELKQEAQSYLDKVKEKTEKTMGNNRIQLRTELIASSSAVSGIVAFAEKEKVELIIVGTKGRSGFTKLLLGSVASGVVTYAHCPVMIVR